MRVNYTAGPKAFCIATNVVFKVHAPPDRMQTTPMVRAATHTIARVGVARSQGMRVGRSSQVVGAAGAGGVWVS